MSRVFKIPLHLEAQPREAQLGLKNVRIRGMGGEKAAQGGFLPGEMVQ